MSRTAVDLAVITALPEELAPLAARFGIEQPLRNTLYQFTTGDHRSLALYCTGPGKVNGAAGVARLLSQVKPGALIGGGIAGGTGPHGPADSPRVKPGDLVIAREVGFYDVDLTAFGAPPGAVHSRAPAELTATILPDPATIGVRPAPAPASAGCVVTGRVLTGDCFLNDRLLRELPPAWRQRIVASQAVDMESAAWVTVADRDNVPWVVLRYISDDITSNERMPFPVACAAAGAFLSSYSTFFLSHITRCC